jgi:hypothetical protein
VLSQEVAEVVVEVTLVVLEMVVLEVQEVAEMDQDLEAHLLVQQQLEQLTLVVEVVVQDIFVVVQIQEQVVLE